MKKIPELQKLAEELIGDEKTPNVFFVSSEGKIQLVTPDFNEAYTKWWNLASSRPLRECALEDRQTGVICSVEPRSDSDKRLVITDTSDYFLDEINKEKKENKKKK